MVILIAVNDLGGYFNFRHSLALHFRKIGYEVHVLVNKLPEEKIIDDSAIHYHRLSLNRTTLNPIHFITFCVGVNSVLRDVRPQFVLSFTPIVNTAVGFACQLSKIKTKHVVNFTGLGTLFVNGSLVRFASLILFRASLRRAAYFTFHNEEDRSIFVKNKIVHSFNSSVLGGSGINQDNYKFRTDFYGIKSIAFVGRLMRDKGFNEFMDAVFAIHNESTELEFHVFGEVSNNTNSVNEERLVEFMALPCVYFHGFVSDLEVRLQSIDGVILPSYREGMPRALLEAMASGCVAYGSDVTGINELIKDGYNGFLFRAHSAQEIVNVIFRTVHMNLPDLNLIRYRAREEVVKNFSTAKVFCNYEFILNKVQNDLKKS